MANITTINEFRQYILRKLGSPVISNIEITNDQIDDCVDEAVQIFYEDHFDGVEIAYINLSVIKDTKEYTLDSKVQAVLEILKTSSSLLSTSDEPLIITDFDRTAVCYSPFVDIVSVEVWRQTIKNYENAFVTDILFDFNTTTHKLFLHMKPKKTETWVLRVYKSNDSLDELYNNLFLKKYSVALAKLQWGNNINKYTGVSLPGGGLFNSSEIISQAEATIEKLEEELYERYSEPIDFFVG